ncbi:uncharacterized protein CMC5_037550 [Chondromyces crocatus]|uniref:Pyrrolo-quinoline quinone repeat domain-containing protein n=2 Tax=Chondromyces crocatus TaxID=52 RepID=A0A0K1EFG6_CHOCO|nr:PQQ-binding-like beta-propeller repeat protein [Chondromyces crocatus]AKT39606.1 uncharacterized protein CMC5_037550 [Chondromyces crocatus]
MYRDPPSDAPLVLTAINGVVVAYDRLSGRQVWRFQATLQGVEHAPTLCVVEGQRVVSVSAKEVRTAMLSWTAAAEVNCLDYLTGGRLWTCDAVGEKGIGLYTATLLVSGGQVLVTQGTQLFAFSLLNGTLQWQQPLRGLDGSDVVRPVSLALPGHTALVAHR